MADRGRQKVNLVPSKCHPLRRGRPTPALVGPRQDVEWGHCWSHPPLVLLSLVLYSRTWSMALTDPRSLACFLVVCKWG